VDELVGGVQAAVEGRIVRLSGACERPGGSGLIPCEPGTPIRIDECPDVDSCIVTFGRAREIAATEAGSDGRWVVEACVAGQALIPRAEFVAEEAAYRTGIIAFGRAFEGGGAGAGMGSGSVLALDGVLLSPNSEATVRLLEENALANFDQQGIDELFDAVQTANPPVAQAAAAAADTAREDAQVQRVISLILRHDVPAPGTLEAQGEIDEFRLTVYENVPIVLQATRSAGNIAPCLGVFGPAGAVAGGAACGQTSARLDLILPPASYTVRVSDEGGTQLGAYTVQYLRVRAEDAVEIVSSPVVQNVAPRGDLDLYRFRLTTSTNVTIRLTGRSGGIQPCMELRMAGAGEALASACDGTAAVQLDRTLVAGTYLLLVSGWRVRGRAHDLTHGLSVTCGTVGLRVDGSLQLYSFRRRHRDRHRGSGHHAERMFGLDRSPGLVPRTAYVQRTNRRLPDDSGSLLERCVRRV
jgi:hypothetical protein